jgi:hypothetical protein
MKKQQTTLQKIGKYLNTSSETFMLIALVSLFALPFVIAANLEPIVKESENTAHRASATIVAKSETTTPTPQISSIQPTTEPKVLGVQVLSNPLMIKEDKNNISFFDKNTSKADVKGYSIELSTNQVFGKIPVFTLKNDSGVNHTYKLNVVNLTQNQTAKDKYIYIDAKQYLIGSKDLPATIPLEAGKEITISLMSNKSRSTNVRVVVELVK